jgi:hypothetical protein
VVRHVKVLLGTFACSGIETYLDSDIAAGVRAAIADFTRRLESGHPPVDLPREPYGAASVDSVTAVDLPLDERSWQLLQHEACRQGTTVGRLAAHSVIVFLAELDRLTPPGTSATA